MGKATQDLRSEHDSILHVLQILDKMTQTTALEKDQKLDYYGQVIYFLKTFADKCHHGKEENILFNELVAKGIPNENGPIGVMLSEHVQGRGFIADMSHGVEERDIAVFNQAAERYAALLRNHIDKENNVLFVMADKVLDEDAQDQMYEKFQQHEEEVIGHGIHEKLHGMIETWAKAIG